ncbi:glucosidase II [Coemansia sp. RSA 1250]|nr:glucosidase II [Coemansia sp. RSA 1250]
MRARRGTVARCAEMLWLAAALLLLVVQGADAVKREDFKTCEQAAFCNRHREFAKNVTAGKAGAAYAVVEGSVRMEQHRLTATVQNEDAVPLALEVTFMASGVMRVRVQEEKPLVARFDDTQKYVLRDEGAALEYADEAALHYTTERTSGGLAHVVSYGGNTTFTMRMAERPWSVTMAVDGRTAVQLNTRGLFKFEHLRTRPEGDVPAGEWDEQFRTWTDTKPRGPEAFGLDIGFAGCEHVYGIPEHSSPLSLRTTRGGKGAYDQPYRLYNLDVFEYEIDNPMALYGSVPLMLAHSADATAGVLWLNAAETWVDVERADGGALGGLFGRREPAVDTHWISEAGVMDVFVLPGPDVARVYKQYAELVEPTPLPREFALGYHQCRWNYLDDADVRTVSAGLHEHGIPHDVMWLDIEHTDGKRYYTWDAAKFPDPAALQQSLARTGHQLVTVVDPHVKRDSGYAVWREADENGLFVGARGGDGSFQGWCWPGDSNWVDCFNPNATAWLSKLYGLDRYNGSTPHLFIWNDMNEPSVFNGPEITMDKDALHHGGWEHRHVHNLNGMLYHKATADGLRARETPNLRPFVLSRSYFAGSQRYGAVWTGDNTADWEHLRASVPMVLSNNVAGIHFVGADVGGFFGNPDPDLLTRWYQLGAWYPFFRAHAHIDTRRREPWLLGEPYVSLIRAAVRQRYRLLPHLYTLFRESSLTGMPLVRPLWVEFPHLPALFAEDRAFMVGSSILVVPVTDTAATQTVALALPADELWYDMNTHESFAGPIQRSFELGLADTLAFARAGSIICTRERPRRSSALMRRDPFTLHVYLSRAADATGSLYVDDGESYAYEQGAFIERDLAFANGTLTSRASSRSVTAPEQAAFAQAMAAVRVERIVVVGAHDLTRASVSEGGSVRQVDVSCSGATCVVRDPAVLIGSDWDIALK